MTDQHNTNLF